MDGGGIFFIKKVHKKLAFLFLLWYNIIKDKEKDGLKQNKRSAVNLQSYNKQQTKTKQKPNKQPNNQTNKQPNNQTTKQNNKTTKQQNNKTTKQQKKFIKNLISCF